MFTFGIDKNIAKPIFRHNGGGNFSIYPVRAKHIILNSEDPLYKKLNQEWSIGMVLFKPINDNSEGYKGCLKKGLMALPLFPNLIQPPLLEELLYIIELPAFGAQTGGESNVKYYFPDRKSVV